MQCLEFELFYRIILYVVGCPWMQKMKPVELDAYRKD